MKLSLVATVFAGLVNAHSWVHCTDYRGDLADYESSQCFGHPRPINGRVPAESSMFGQDTGFNQQPGPTKCHSNAESKSGDFGMAVYKRGQRVTMAWPAKNHAAATCTNQWIPDTALELYMATFAGVDAEPNWIQIPASFSDDPHVEGQIDFKGFQNCPKFCESTDKALCTGNFVVPSTLGGKPVANGVYSFQWRWTFNRGTSPYVTCFEAEIADGTVDPVTTGPPVVTTTAAPVVPTTVATPTPTTDDDSTQTKQSCAKFAKELKTLLKRAGLSKKKIKSQVTEFQWLCPFFELNKSYGLEKKKSQ